MASNLVADVTVTGNVVVQGINTSVQFMNASGSSNLITLVYSQPISSCSLGARHGVFLLNDKTARATGDNSSGGLGDNTTTLRTTIVSMVAVSTAVAIAAGVYNTMIVMSSGEVYGTGRNTSLQLGDGTNVNKSTIVPMIGITSGIAVDTGSHTLVLLKDGTVMGCGSGAAGQLGTGLTIYQTTAVPMLNVSTAAGVATGTSHSLVLLKDGSVYGVGYNFYGQLGDRTKTNKLTVVKMIGISTAVQVSGGVSHSAILLKDGKVFTVGSNQYGQLGVGGTTSTYSTVVQVLGISTAVCVSCRAADSTLIVLNDGTAYAVGRNRYGNLGDNSITDRSTIVQVIGVTNAIAVSGGDGAFYLLSDGKVLGVGLNYYGDLGISTTLRTTYSTVVAVIGITSAVVVNNPQEGVILNTGSLGIGLTPTTSYQLDLSTDGARKAATSTWTTGSDERIKQNIVSANLARCAEIVDALDLKYFKWKDDVSSQDKHSLGWIAQEVQEFFPKSVDASPAHGIDDFHNLNSDQLIKVLYGAIKHTINEYFPEQQ